MMREVVHYVPGRSAPRAVSARTRALPVIPPSEMWTGPEMELRARLRDQARDLRVRPGADVFDQPGLPRGWVAMRVYFTDHELTRATKPKPRVPRWAWIAGAIVAILGGVTALGYWVYLQLAGLVAGISVGAGVGVGVVLALLLAAAGGTTVITVVTQVTIRRGWW